MARKAWFVDVPQANPDPNRPETLEWIPSGPPDGFSKRKDAIDWAAKMYGAVAGKIQLVTSSDDKTPEG
jgi:hypothetical protein